MKAGELAHLACRGPAGSRAGAETPDTREPRPPLESPLTPQQPSFLLKHGDKQPQRD